MLSGTNFRTQCPIACALDIIGDKWTLLIVRDLLPGDKTYQDLQASVETIPANILSTRLRRLARDGVISKQLYQERPKRYSYRLTRLGENLSGTLRELMLWGEDLEASSEASGELKALLQPKEKLLPA
jgi:DNA-binding HxlR family transcriptional regulator